jgi:hypothetical protein
MWESKDYCAIVHDEDIGLRKISRDIDATWSISQRQHTMPAFISDLTNVDGLAVEVSAIMHI